MGSEFKAGNKLTAKVDAASNLKILRIDLIKEGKVVQYSEPDHTQASWSSVENQPLDPTWYYVRLTLEGEHLAWSSPIWVDP